MKASGEGAGEAVTVTALHSRERPTTGTAAAVTMGGGLKITRRKLTTAAKLPHPCYKYCRDNA